MFRIRRAGIRSWIPVRVGLAAGPAVVLFVFLPILAAACASKVPVAKEVRGTANGEYLVFLSTVQGNPLCLFASIQRLPENPVFGSSRTKWGAHVWTIVPGAARYVFAEKGSDKQDPATPLFWADECLLFTTDKDRFVFYRPFEVDKLLFLTDAIYPERVRQDRDEEIRYGIVPSLLYWNNRKLEGRSFYERRVLTASTADPATVPIAGLPKGARAYALWAPDGAFVYLERMSDPATGSPVSFVLLQDRRGRWEEAFDAELEEPLCAFSPSACPPEAAALRISVALWGLEGSLEVLQGVRSGLEAQAQEQVRATETAGAQALLWDSLKNLGEERKKSPVAFCLLKGSLTQRGEIRAVYGIGMTSNE